MDDKRIRIKYQGYDPTLDERLTALAVALGAEFSDRPLGDGVREMSFNFENDRHGNASTTRDIFQIVSIERSHLRRLGGENPTNELEAADAVVYKLERKVRAKLRAELRNPESSSVGDHGVALPPPQPRIRTRRKVQLRRKFATAVILVTIGVIGIRATLTRVRNS